MTRHNTTGKAAKARRLKAEKPERGASPAASSRHPSPDADFQDQLEQKTRELAEARKLLAEALEQQTATSEVLGAISSSPGDLQPVFKAMLENAVRICAAKFGNLFLYEQDSFRVVAQQNPPPAYAERWRREPVFRVGDGPRNPLARLAKTGRVVDIADLTMEPGYIERDPRFVALVESAGARTHLLVPMLKEGELIGAIAIYRQEVKSFSDKQIELVQNFAAQAVIAIENTRLLNELRQRTDDLTESLEQQTATSEVLKVISSSPGELELVFQAMLENATRICGAKYGVLWQAEGQGFRSVAVHGMPPAYTSAREQEPVIYPGPEVPLARLALTKQVLQVTDIRNDESYIKGFRPIVNLADAGGARTLLLVPMLKENDLMGAIAIFRQEVKQFTDKQIELVSNFAAQAVIAIENTRLLNELRQRTDDLTESLEQQTATSEVLQVISSSPGELQPVFDAMLENAVRLCTAKFGILWLVDEGDMFRSAAIHGLPPAHAEARLREPLVRHSPNTLAARGVATKTLIHVDDMRNDIGYLERNPRVIALVELGGARTAMFAPLLKDDEAIGGVVIYRQEVRPFTDRQIELLQNFAAQAVIAIENTRLLNELRESLARQTATAEVLRVISSSPGNIEPVFAAMLDNAARICEAKSGFLFRTEGDGFRVVASLHQGADDQEQVEHGLLKFPAFTPIGRVALTRQIVHVPNLAEDRAYLEREPLAVWAVEHANVRAMLTVPMLKGDELIGIFGIERDEVRPFTDEQIELVKNFSAQAVIAIENARLLNELRQRTDDLSEALEQQTATSQVLKIISSSPGQLNPVFDAMLESAARICEASFGIMMLAEGDKFRRVALHNAPPEYEALHLRDKLLDPAKIPTLARLASVKHPIHTLDMALEEPDAPVAKAGGARALLTVPMLREDELVGAIGIYRREVRPFTEKQIELVKNFAAQAVIAIENTRLLNELRESLQRQTATADVLKTISRSTFDLKTVLNTLVESAARLSESDFATLNRQFADGYRQVASYGLTGETAQMIEARPLSAGRGSVVGRTLLERRPIQIVDVLADPEFQMVEAATRTGANTILGVPLLREGIPIGVMTLQRRTKKPYSDKQIELLITFADQAVIAIENVRLFESVEARTRELAQSLEDLQTAQDRLVQTQKLASLGQLTAGIAHEIKNPLNFVNNFSAISGEMLDELRQALQKGQFDQNTRAEIDELTKTLRGNLDKIEQHGKRADSIVKNMLLHSREGSGEHRPVDINALVEESLNLAYHGARAEKQGFNITMERSFDPAAGEVDLFPQEFTRVLLNMISNGFYAATKRKAEADGGGYEPTLAAATKSLGDSVEIKIRDNGTGIPPEVKEKMYNPFFTTKPAGEGTGLGLSLSYDIIVKQHAGSIEVDTEPGQFTEFRIILPRNAASYAKARGRS